jgi:hypothetical protein
MKYTFSFKEINYGSIEIESDHVPEMAEVEEAIINGGAFLKDTEYEDIKLVDTRRRRERDNER